MADVVPLIQPEPLILICDCGCCTYMLQSDGTAVCAACKAPTDQDGAGWLAQAGSAQTRHDIDEVYADVSGNGSVEFARQRVQQIASGDDVALIVVARDDGRTFTWSSANTDERADWAKRRLEQAGDLIASHARTFLNGVVP